MITSTATIDTKLLYMTKIEYIEERALVRLSLDSIRFHRENQRKADGHGESGHYANARRRWRLDCIQRWRQIAWEHRNNARRIRLTGNICPF